MCAGLLLQRVSRAPLENNSGGQKPQDTQRSAVKADFSVDLMASFTSGWAGVNQTPNAGFRSGVENA